MLINPFVVGVFVTLFVEMSIYVLRDMSRRSRCRQMAKPVAKR